MKRIQKENKKNILNENFIVKPDKFAFYFCLFIPIGVILIPTINTNFFRYPFPGMWTGIGILVIIIIIILLLFKNLYIEIKDGEMIYNRLFEGKIRIKIKDIKMARQITEVHRFKPLVRLTITPKKETGLKEFDITTFIMENKGYKRLLKILPMKKSRAEGLVEEWVNDVIEEDIRKTEQGERDKEGKGKI